MSHFNKSNNIPLEELGAGLKRQILGYESDLMLVRVFFEQGAIGAVHTHPHQQVTYLEKGRFEVEIGSNKDILKAGDSFTVPANMSHGVLALEEGILLDAFSPAREDFLK